MTTVAVDLDRMAMACDSRCTSGDPDFSTQKIYKSPDGTLIGFAGNVNDALIFVEWFQAGADRSNKPEFTEKGSFSALTLNKDGCSTWDNDCMRIAMCSRFYAIGSGGMAAMTARHCGKSIEECVHIACLMDSQSGGPVIVQEYLEIKTPVKRRAPNKNKKGTSK
jgi:ATP-dependent protease HslVU (ClpYQ) peptidase subunit